MQSLLRDQDKIDHGFEQGQLVKAKEVAQSLLSSGMPASEVANHEKLSLGEVTQLKIQTQIQ